MLMVTPSLGLGGTELQAALLAEDLQNWHGARVMLCGLGAPSKAAELFSNRGLSWVSMPVDWYRSRRGRLVGAWRLLLLMRQMRPDIILSFSHIPNVLCGLTWRLSGAKSMIWHQWEQGQSYQTSKLSRLAVSLVPFFVSNSEHGASFLQLAFGVPSERIKVVRNGVPESKRNLFKADARNRLKIPIPAFVVSMIANFWPLKDHATLVRAWALVLQDLGREDKEGQLLLPGADCGAEHDVRKLVSELKLSANEVRFLGQTTDVDVIYAASDVFAFTSTSEGLPNVVLEAMSHGLPVAGVDIRGTREALGPGADDWLVPPGDYRGLAIRLLRLAKNEQLREVIGEQGKARILSEFSVDRMIQAELEAIETCLQRARVL